MLKDEEARVLMGKAYFIWRTPGIHQAGSVAVKPKGPMLYKLFKEVKVQVSLIFIYFAYQGSAKCQKISQTKV